MQPGLRGIFFYFYDVSFTGADLVVQELNLTTLQTLLSDKKFVSQSKPIQSAYEFLALLDGRCDVQLKCEQKESAKTVEKTCPAKEICPTCEKCENCQTPKCAICENKECEQPKCLNGAPDSGFPDCCTNGGKGKFCCTTGFDNTECSQKTTPPPKSKCLNGAPDSAFPDCCTNGGQGADCKVTSRPTRTVRTTTKRTFAGLTYLPQPTQPRTFHEPWTGTYRPNTAVFRQTRAWVSWLGIKSVPKRF